MGLWQLSWLSWLSWGAKILKLPFIVRMPFFLQLPSSHYIVSFLGLFRSSLPSPTFQQKWPSPRWSRGHVALSPKNFESRDVDAIWVAFMMHRSLGMNSTENIAKCEHSVFNGQTFTAMKLAGQLPRITGLTTSFLLGPFFDLLQIGVGNPSPDSNLSQRIDTDNTNSHHSLLD